MKNLYVFYDTVSGNHSDVISFENDSAMMRSAVRTLASVLPEIARDTVLFHVGTLDTESGCPVIHPCDPPRPVFYGTSPEVASMREVLMEEASRFASSAGGDSDEE